MNKPSSFTLILALTMTGLSAGVMLSGVYKVTQPSIQKNKANFTKKAIFNVLPGTTEFKSFAIDDGVITPFDDSTGDLPGDNAVFMGIGEQGQATGFAMPADGPGFMDTIKVLYGYMPAKKTIVGLQILESKETPGLGDKIMKDDDFKNSFLALQVEPEIVLIKKGELTEANQVDGISGATISSDAVVKILNASVKKLPQQFPTQEPKSQESP